MIKTRVYFYMESVRILTDTLSYCYHHKTEKWRDRRSRWQVWGKKIAFTVLEGKYQGMVPLGRPSHRYEDNIKMKLKKYYGGCVLDFLVQWWTVVNKVKKMGILMKRGRHDFFSTMEVRC